MTPHEYEILWPGDLFWAIEHHPKKEKIRSGVMDTDPAYDAEQKIASNVGFRKINGSDSIGRTENELWQHILNKYGDFEWTKE